MAQDGSVYFAPCYAGKVLRISAGGNIELLEPEIAGRFKYRAGGVLAQDGSVYFAPCNAGKVLRSSA